MVLAPPPLPTQFPCWCRAVYSWGGESKRDLGFIEGDLIECLNAGDGSWWTGKLWRDRRTVGVFPSNFVELLPPNFRPTTRSVSPLPDHTPNPKPVPQKSKTFRKPFEAYAKAPHYTTAKQPEVVRESPHTRARDNSASSYQPPAHVGRSPSPAPPLQHHRSYDARASGIMTSELRPPLLLLNNNIGTTSGPHHQLHRITLATDRERHHLPRRKLISNTLEPSRQHLRHRTITGLHRLHHHLRHTTTTAATDLARHLLHLRSDTTTTRGLLLRPRRWLAVSPVPSFIDTYHKETYDEPAREDSPPPPPPPPHRHVNASRNSFHPSQESRYAGVGRQGSNLSYEHRQDGLQTPRMPSPCPPSPGGSHMTPSPLREAMDGVIEQLDALGMPRDTRTPEPAPLDPWSPECFDMVSHREKNKTAQRPQTSMGLGHQDEGYETWSGGSSQEASYQNGQREDAHDAPQLSNYVERMETRLQGLQHSNSTTSHDEPPPPPPKGNLYQRPKSSMGEAPAPEKKRIFR
ncbi:cytokinesis protein 3 like [Verticillium longisporum]|nr:cytokinesis protein 3 like [Verticillium longisporum]